ncbi:MAG: hypothetical protein QOH69_3236 [Actinomycetota bacterium]|jgi:hypothetical protein|nr:hypothetical protein [Actinomycetota bacterium]
MIGGRTKPQAPTTTNANDEVIVAFDELTMPTGLLVGTMPTPAYVRLEYVLQELAAGISKP